MRQNGSYPDVKITDSDVVFGYTYLPHGFTEGHHINSYTAISLASQKNRQRKILADNHVPVPQTYLNCEAVPFPFIARPPKHCQGGNFLVVKDYADLDVMRKKFKDGWYYSEIFPTKKEYRVVMWRDEILFAFEKPIKSTPLETVAFRRANQHLLSDPRHVELSDAMKKTCIDAIAVIGLDFGGIDLMVSDDRVCVCEVNSAPVIRPGVIPKLKQKLVAEHLYIQS